VRPIARDDGAYLGINGLDRFRLLDVSSDHFEIFGLKQQAVQTFDRQASDITPTNCPTTVAC
jgi:hypothetical protein